MPVAQLLIAVTTDDKGQVTDCAVSGNIRNSGAALRMIHLALAQILDKLDEEHAQGAASTSSPSRLWIPGRGGN